jgi:hypothetical protein
MLDRFYKRGWCMHRHAVLHGSLPHWSCLACWNCLGEQLADKLLQDITLQNVDLPMINNVVEFGERGVLRVRRKHESLVPDCTQ